MQVATAESHATLETHFNAQLRTLGPFETQPHLAIAVSGGADSMALCLLGNQWAKAHNGKVTAIIIDHGLRNESALEAQQTQNWLRGRMIETQIIRVTVSQNKNLQNAARQARYDALIHWCKTHYVMHLLLGHHEGDQVETVALHTQRGTTIDGPSGMAALSHRAGIRLIRPLLSITKPVLQHYLQLHEQPWASDPSNNDAQFARVQIRKMLTQNRAEYHAFLEQADTGARARQNRERQLADDAANCLAIYPEAYGMLYLDSWKALAKSHATTVLANSIRCLSGQTNRVRQHEIERLYEMLLAANSSFNKATLGGLLFTAQPNNTVLITREIKRMPALTITEKAGKLLYDQRFIIDWQGLDILPDTASFQIKPLEYKGFNSALPHRIDQLGIPKPALLCQPALWQLDLPIWIPHIGFMNKSPSKNAQLAIEFAPAKPLADSAVWCLNSGAQNQTNLRKVL